MVTLLLPFNNIIAVSKYVAPNANQWASCGHTHCVIYYVVYFLLQAVTDSMNWLCMQLDKALARQQFKHAGIREKHACIQDSGKILIVLLYTEYYIYQSGMKVRQKRRMLESKLHLHARSYMKLFNN